MATTSSVQTKKQQLSDLIECPICTEVYEDPRTLPCIHSFCLKCIDRYIKSNKHRIHLACPLCRQQFVLPVDGVYGLPKNFFIGKLFHVEELSNSIKRADNRCEACNGDEHGSSNRPVAAVYCVECQQRMCASCAELHRKFAVSRGHRHIDLSGNQDGDVAAEQLIKHQPTVCDKHPGEQLKLFCVECRVAMCVICYVKLHNSHKCWDVNEVVDEFRQQMRTDIVGLANCSTEFHGVMNELNEDRRSLVDQADNIEQSVRDRAEHLLTEIDRSKRKLIDEVMTSEQRRLKQIDTVYAEIEERLALVDSLKRNIEGLIEQGSPSGVVLEVTDLHQQAVNLTQCKVIHQSFNELGTMAINFTPANLHENQTNLIGDFVCRLQKCTKGLSQWSSSLAHVIPSGGVVGGVTKMGDRLYVVRIAVNQVEVYDTRVFSLQRKININGACNLFGITSCIANNCLYVADHYGSKIHKIELMRCERIRNWQVASCPVGLAVNRATNVLVACYGTQKIQEYTTNGLQVRVVNLASSVAYPIHVAELSSGKLVVAYGSWDSTYCVSVVDDDGTVIRHYFDEVQPSAKQLSGSSTLAVDSNDNILLCEWSTRRILILNPSLTAARDLPIAGVAEGLNEPWSLCLDEPNGRLYVGEWGGQRVFAFNIVSDVK